MSIDLRETLEASIRKMFGRELPKAPPEAKALAAVVAHDLAEGDEAGRTLYFVPRSSNTREILERHEVPHVKRGWLAEIVVTSAEGQGRETPLLAGETVVDPSGGVDYGFDFGEDMMYPRDVYVWEFRKLLRFRAPHFLFFARVNRESGDKSFSRLDKLEDTLLKAAEVNREDWKNMRLDMVLMPSSKRDIEQTRLMSCHGGQLGAFQRL